MYSINPEDYAQILDNVPHVIMRLRYADPDWNIYYINRAIERYGYRKEDFLGGKKTWNDMLHPDDLVVSLKLSGDYLKNKIDDFKLQYRVLTAGGASIYMTEYTHVNRKPDGSLDTIDSFLIEDLEAMASAGPERDAALRRNLALNDILLTIQDANADPEKAIQFILDRVGALLDCSRALLFKDSDDHKTCKVVYEWLNHGISSIKNLDYAVTYSTEMPEIYVALQDTGVLLVNAGEIPENCKEEFEAEGLLSSAIFAIYQYGDHYGFVCFDDCIIERRWDPDTANFLKVVANLLSNVVMNLQSEKYMRGYEEKIKSLAFRDYLTGLPNQYPYNSDIGDLILAANAAGVPAHAAMIALDDIGVIRNTRGLKTANDVCKKAAEEVQEIAKELLGETATAYRIAGTAFAVLVQPGPEEPVRAFAEKVVERGTSPWRVESGEYACAFKVAVIPFGVKNSDPDAINEQLDAAFVTCASASGCALTFVSNENA